MRNAYQDPKNAQKYLDFLNSENGRLQQKFLWNAISAVLPANGNTAILDAACGNGWLSQKLAERYAAVRGCDISEVLINFAKKQNPNIQFKICDLCESSPFEKNSFDVIILNMAAPDFYDLNAAFSNLSRMLKKGGQLIITIPNPPLTFPAAVWKRGIAGWIFRKKPKLKFNKIKAVPQKIIREFNKDKIPSFYHTLEDYFKAAQESGLIREDIKKISSLEDSGKFNLQYQLFRYPLLLLIIFKKQLQ